MTIVIRESGVQLEFMSVKTQEIVLTGAELLSESRRMRKKDIMRKTVTPKMENLGVGLEDLIMISLNSKETEATNNNVISIQN